MEVAMSVGEVVVLGFIIAAFVTFGATLAWVSHADGAPRAKARQPRQIGFPSWLRHSH